MKLDLELLAAHVEKLVGDGQIAESVVIVRVAVERACTSSPEKAVDLWHKSQTELMAVGLMIRGAFNIVRNTHELAAAPDVVAEALLPWRQMEESAGLCLHNLARLPEDMRIWKSRPQ